MEERKMKFVVIAERLEGGSEGTGILSISQVEATGPDGVILAWMRDCDPETLNLSEGLSEQIGEDDGLDTSVTPIEDMQNVWCGSVHAGRDLILVHIFQRPDVVRLVGEAAVCSRLYSFCFFKAGGTYLSQHEAETLDGAIEAFASLQPFWNAETDKIRQVRQRVDNPDIYELKSIGPSSELRLLAVVTDGQ